MAGGPDAKAYYAAQEERSRVVLEGLNAWCEKGWNKGGRKVSAVRKIKPPFINLHGHTEYSVMDGVTKVKEVLQTAEEKGMDSIAITDHGTMAGVLPFFLTAKEMGFKTKPIIGVEAYLDDDRHLKKSKKAYHLVLLAKNIEGYKNLCRIVSDAHRNGFYYRPRTCKEALRKWSEGVIALSACIGGEIPQVFLQKEGNGKNKKYTVPPNKQMQEAMKLVNDYKEIFGDDFYLEFQFNALKEQSIVNDVIAILSQTCGVKTVVTTDFHYAHPEDSRIQQIQLELITNSDTFAMHDLGLFIKDGKEVFDSFQECGSSVDVNLVKESILRTKEISDSIDICDDLNRGLGIKRFPSFDTKGTDKAEYLKALCRKGFIKLIEQGKILLGEKERYLEQLKHEFDVIVELGFEEYFLVVSDMVKWAKAQGIFCGPGRGSAAGCLLSWVLEITKIDPIKHGLMFERFLNKDRGDHPDIDCDFSSARRDEVIDYLRDKYGENNVAQIITHTAYRGRSVIQDLSRYFRIPQFIVERFNSQMDPKNPSVISWAEETSDEEIHKALSPLVKGRKYNGEQLTTELFLEFAIKMEEQLRQYGTHPGGVVVSPKPLDSLLPLQRNKDVIVTAFDESNPHNCLSQLGLIKIDVLSIETLDVIKEAIDSIKEHEGVDLTDKIWDLPLDDPLVIEETAKGNTLAAFQFESEGIRRALRKIKPTNFSDIVAVNALYRPGAMDGIDEFAKNKHNPDFECDPRLEGILDHTYGKIVYQEQVVQMFSAIGGFTPTQADIARKKVIKLSSKSIGDKEEQQKRDEELDGIFENFRLGALDKGFNKEWVDDLQQQVMTFAKYSFNVAHATSYTYVFYATQYLKLHYTEHFFTALLNHSNLDQRLRYIREAKRLGVKVLPPHINRSQEHFSIEGQKRIRYGLAEIKHIKSKAQKIIDGRPWNGLIDVAKGCMKGRALESLVDAGAFDLFGNRADTKREYNQKVVGYGPEDVERLANEKVQERQEKNEVRIAEGKKPYKDLTLDDCLKTFAKKLFTPNDSKLKRLLAEKEAIGYYRTHPLALKAVQPWAKEQACLSRDSLEDANFGKILIVLGIVEDFGKRYNRMRYIISDPTGPIEIFVSTKFIGECGEQFDLGDIGKGSIILCSGTKAGDGRINIKANSELSPKLRFRYKNRRRRSLPLCQMHDVTSIIEEILG
jgi:DNA polymerase-3 subunit alpha